jgi:hypothetical protein
MLHVNRMVFGAQENGQHAAPAIHHSEGSNGNKYRLPFSCGLALILAAVPMLLLGVYIPKPLHDLLTLAGAALTK